ncbi:MAG: hypothetical protein LUH07_07430 [Lachnospiraceae bacterium]|nr:hypothetical protein [Lachnospiraceae bacterium]
MANYMELPREPQFYQNEETIYVDSAVKEETLQSINNTLKRIEAILLSWTKDQSNFCHQCLASGASADEVSRQIQESVKEVLSEITNSP